MVPVNSKVLVVVVLLMLVLSSVSLARLRYIPDNYTTIQAAINDGGGGDTLIVRPGEYHENISFDGQELILASEFLLTREYSKIEQTILDGDSLGPVVNFSNGETNDAVLLGFTIQHGALEDGAGVHCDHGSPTIAYNIIRDNYSIRSAGGNGGGIYCFYSTALIVNNVIFDNYAGGGFAGFGGGVAIRSADAVLINNTITRNHSNQIAGGLFITWSTPVVTNTILWNNQAEEDGNEIYVNECTPIITYCDIHAGYEGEGNINSNPEFRDVNSGDFHLMATEYGYSYDSPCIDVGNPQIRDHQLDSMWGLGAIASDIGAYGGSDSVGTGIIEELQQIPARIDLAQNYPNPFNPKTTIEFDLDSQQFVSLKVFNPLGQELATLVQSSLAAGEYKLVFDASGYASGRYYYILKTGESTETRCMTLIK
jgi:hypothetical protein